MTDRTDPRVEALRRAMAFRDAPAIARARAVLLHATCEDFAERQRGARNPVSRAWWRALGWFTYQMAEGEARKADDAEIGQ